MKVLLINGSPDANGCVARALREMESVFAAEGVEPQTMHVGNKPIRGCAACGRCRELGRCVFNDAVNEAAAALAEADGLVLGAPVYYAHANGGLLAFADRLFYSAPFDKSMKVGAAVVSSRRAGSLY